MILTVVPAAGSTFGGDHITITGKRFDTATTATVGGAAVSSLTFVNETTLTAVTPVHAAGIVDVEVSAQGRRVVSKNAFTYTVPPVTTNLPPVIDALQVRGTRERQPAGYGNINEVLQAVATVHDDTPNGSLKYSWQTSAGTVSGTGPSVTLTTPATTGPVQLSLTVTEDYAVAGPTGLPVPQTHTVTASTKVSVHDELAEVSGMSKDFLVRFSQSSVSPLDVMHNFRDHCGANGSGRQDELAQVVNNRARFVILDWSVADPRTTVSFDGLSPFRSRRADAWSSVNVRWTSKCIAQDSSIGCNSVGQVGDVIGVDWVTAIFDAAADRWWLCDSDFQPTNAIFKGFMP